MNKVRKTNDTDQAVNERPFGKKRFLITLLFTLVTLSILVYTNWRSYVFFKQMFIERFVLMEINSKIPQLDEALTMSAKLAAATGDLRWKTRYDTLSPQLDSLILLARKLNINILFNISAKQVDSANLQLVDMEKEAFNLIQSGHQSEAIDLLASREYNEGKKEYRNSFHQMQTDFWNYNLDLMKKEHFKLLFSLFSTFILFPLLLLTWYSVLKSMQKYFNDRKQAEETLKESEKRHRDILENLNDVIFTLNTDKIITYISPQVEQMYGYVPEELIGQPIFKIVHPEDHKLIDNGFLSPLEDELVTREFQYVTKDGQVRWAQTRSRRVMEDGRITGIDGIFTDVTERRKAEDALIDSKAFLNSIIDSTEDLIWSVESEKFGLMTFNKGLFNYFMKSGLQIRKGMVIEEMLPEPFANTIKCLYIKTLKDGFVSQFYEASNNSRILLLNLHLLSKDNKPYAISVFGKDITEMKESEVRIRNQFEELQRWNKATENREERIMELKEEINELLIQAGKPVRYENT